MPTDSATATAVPAGKVKTSGPTDLAYILSANFSGSTLLAMLLGAQPEATTVGEMRAPHVDEDAYQCSCGEKIKEDKFWIEVSERMAKHGIPDFDIRRAQLSIHESDSAYLRRVLKPLPRGFFLEAVRSTALTINPGWQRHLHNVQHRNSAFAKVLQEITGAKVIVDSSKIAFHLKCLLKSPELNVKVIRLVRDGRAVTMSTIGHGFKAPTRHETVAGAALSWLRNNEAAERVLAELPASQWMHLQYEELCRQPEETLRGVCKFLGMDSQNIVLDFRARTQHVLGNEMRLKSGSDIRLDERWRTGLSKEDLEAFEEVAGGMNRNYGYK